MLGYLGSQQCILLLRQMDKIIAALPNEEKWRGEQVWTMLVEASVQPVQVDIKQRELADEL